MLLGHDNFQLALFALAAQYLTAEFYFTPYISMLRQSTKPEQQGLITAVYLFCADGLASVFTYLLDLSINARVDSIGPVTFTDSGSWEGFVIFSFNVVSLVGMVPFVYAAGQEYDRRRAERRLT